MGAHGLLRAPAEVVTRPQAQIVRLLLMCAAWAVGQVLTFGLSVQGLDLVVPAALAIGVYVVTDDLGRPRFNGGNARYWRGRRIDEDPPKRDRWN
jgi:hypothetical protein